MCLEQLAKIPARKLLVIDNHRPQRPIHCSYIRTW
jgi:hypothetical protein